MVNSALVMVTLHIYYQALLYLHIHFFFRNLLSEFEDCLSEFKENLQTILQKLNTIQPVC